MALAAEVPHIVHVDRECCPVTERRRDSPDEDDRTDTSQSCVERFGHGEVADNDFDVRWQRRRRLGAMREGPDRHRRVYGRSTTRRPTGS